jgi:arabinogalactan oligomer/maltooligosaccharide transport system substrate-binding protein
MKYTIRKAIIVPILFLLCSCIPPINYLEDSIGQNSLASNVDFSVEGDILVWFPMEDESISKEIIKSFNSVYPNVHVNYNLVAENKSKDTYNSNAERAADVFAVVDNDIASLAETKSLVELSTSRANYIKEISIPWTIDTISYPLNDPNAKLYGYPQTADNGYLLVYNKQLINSSQVNSLESILEVAKAQNKRFLYDYKNGFYLPGVFLANEGHLGVHQEGTTFVQECDFNNAQGVQTAERMKEIILEYDSALYSSSDNGEIQTMFKNNSAIGVITGTWNIQNIETAIGKENVGFAPLPTINIAGSDKVIGAFRGTKALVIKSNTKYLAASLAYAEFATSAEAQLLRFRQRQVGPSILTVSELDEVKNNLMLNALSSSQNAPTSVSQALATTPKFWDALGSLGSLLAQKGWGSFKSAQDALNAIVAQMVSN